MTGHARHRLDPGAAEAARLALAPVIDRSPGAGLPGAARWQLVLKRAVDVLGSSLLLAALMPMLLLAAAAVLVTTRGPVLYLQERVGRDAQPFRIIKFRSMYHDAETRLGDLSLRNECTGPVFKMRNDPRITPVGRLLRRMSIDELPQLFNVLRGEMSMVGPRPPLPAEVATYTAHERQRLSVKPGLTCIWQVSGRSDVDFGHWIEMDLEYIRRWSLRLDLVLMLRTIPAVLSGKGAY